MEEDILAEEQEVEDPLYTLVLDGSQKSKPKLVDRNGFTYVIKEVTQNKIDYRCSKRPCKATVAETNSTGDRVPGKHNHSHTAEAGKIVSVQVRAQVSSTLY
ncbi:uncharacterized protein LOC124261812 [Haliotis rubra]|uniref:uncharacterized protein LOC124261812 n=1 Tax=Haliotis rubra TaxID=36100 RepID=UPI001EE551C9|nr:uncharacterized protein LOC124261812 [Haliotis rubra]